MRWRKHILSTGFAVVVACSVCCALVMTRSGGTWPDSWPRELEPLRERATTIDVAHGIQETVYEIPFANREEFERLWPTILQLKSKGSPLILESSPSTYPVSGSTMSTGVRILCPVDGSRASGNSATQPATGPSRQLPEYEVDEGGKRVPYTGQARVGFQFRARVDIVLVTDGQTVDLNRISLPADTPIVDRRFGRR